ncbi:MAG: chalcone isomerase family protein [Thiobacillus sp.]|nr:chalcone isomerase family protein [Thiobacillus sp.]MDP2977684.1 chalcone isomerase family protein [Thiobacillus sp.]
MNTRLSTTLAAACLLATSALHASPLPHLPSFEAVGSGTMRFFGLRLYDATLWSPGGVWSASQPYALELVYARSFDGGAIAQRSIEEMRAQRPWPEATLARWEKDMRALFPDVDKGDRLIGVRMPGAGATFYSGSRKLGQINDEAFADAFFGIWLNPATRAPGLRAQLLKSP